MGLFREIGNFLNSATGVTSSAKQQQGAQLQLQKDAQNFNATEAQKERDWQTYMSNTEHQRAVADMQQAGINPILAAGAGADVSGGASASVSPGEATTGANGGNPLSMILNTIATAKNIDKINADITNQTDKTKAEVNKLLKEAGYTQKQIEYYNKHGVFPGATTSTKVGVNGGFGLFGGNTEITEPVGLKGGKGDPKRYTENSAKKNKRIVPDMSAYL